jgi:hypothetical protein
VYGDRGPDLADAAVVVLRLSARPEAPGFQPREQLADDLAKARLCREDFVTAF